MLSLPKEYSPNAHKKRAIRYGIENSIGEIIITTDADCVYSKNWLGAMLGNVDDETVRHALVNGSVVASIGVEDFSLDNLARIGRDDVDTRLNEFLDMIRV